MQSFKISIFFQDVTGGEEADDTVEDTRSVRSIGNSKDKKKKKKVRKVMSWNF